MSALEGAAAGVCLAVCVDHQTRARARALIWRLCVGQPRHGLRWRRAYGLNLTHRTGCTRGRAAALRIISGLPGAPKEGRAYYDGACTCNQADGTTDHICEADDGCPACIAAIVSAVVVVNIAFFVWVTKRFRKSGPAPAQTAQLATAAPSADPPPRYEDRQSLQSAVV